MKFLLGLVIGLGIGWVIGILRIPVEKPDPDYLEKMTALLWAEPAGHVARRAPRAVK